MLESSFLLELKLELDCKQDDNMTNLRRQFDAVCKKFR